MAGIVGNVALIFRTFVGLAASLMLTPMPLSAQAPAPRIEVEQLLADGWEIAGYGALSFEGRSFILFKHKDKHYLVQCSVLYDVTRTKRVATNCYEIR
jgi:hypothetical protein